jgi:6-phosphofructokinase 1
MAGSEIKRIGVLTAGGDCPGLNAVIRAVSKTAMYQHGIEVVGFLDGYGGLVENRFTELNSDKVSGILTAGGTILGSSNLDNPFGWVTGFDAEGKAIKVDRSDDAVAVYKEHRLDALVCIGGDGTMSIGGQLAAKGVRVVGVPKTIDNDIAETDLTFGFQTAVAIATDALDRIHTTAMSHHRTMIVEVMGRYAGWIALYAGIASGADVILLPEIPYHPEIVADYCKARARSGKRRFTVICVSEGAKPVGGKLTVERMENRSFDAVRLGGVGNKLANELRDAGLDCRATILGHVQRGGTPIPADRVLATRLGHRAMELIMAGRFNMMAAWREGTVSEVAIEKVINRQRLVPPDYHLIPAARAVGTCFGDVAVPVPTA